MARTVARFVCQSCGAVTSKWSGRCESCGEWNTIVEETPRPGPAAKAAPGRGIAFVGLAGEAEPPPRTPTAIAELDRVLGGGLVPGFRRPRRRRPRHRQVHPPAPGRRQPRPRPRPRPLRLRRKSIDQVRLRARRLGVSDAQIGLAAAVNLRDIAAALEQTPATMVVIDSIQTMWLDTIDSAPGTVTQVRAAGFELIRMAKSRGFALILVGHVTKDGSLAGPRVLEHMVDAVLYFEGERGHQFRILRAVKNRFGATDEIGVFEMTDRGLAEVPNPSALFLAERRGNIAGSAVFAGLEGTRPVLVEVQALLSPNSGGPPRRAVVGWEGGRLAMLLAVLEARCGLKLATTDVFLNIAGGLRIAEPAADLAVAAAIASAAADQPTSPGTVYFGEIGLSGEVRQVAQAEARLKEAAKLGFDTACLPRRVARGSRAVAAPEGLRLNEIGHAADLVAGFKAD